MGQVIRAWANVKKTAVFDLFSGDDEEIDRLYSIIANGHAQQVDETPPNSTYPHLDDFVNSASWAYTIPVGWTLSGSHGFIIDSSFDCSTTGNPLSNYMTDAVASASKYCYTPTNKLYYLVGATGDGQFALGGGGTGEVDFQMLPGLDKLGNNTTYDAVTLDTLVLGSINTYLANGNTNGGAPPDPTNAGSMSDLMGIDPTIPITTAGFVQLPICTAQLAHYN
ncbi:hypothetical protein F5Y16DRAFT_248164 [Xylariaceae sp. FL0255]|nr:hypothetical protein F5Y16DRAFT_248164 [Xylariaceae sp. FL0255]